MGQVAPGSDQHVEAEVAAASVHSSCCSARTMPDEAGQGVEAGKMPTTPVRRRISRFGRSCPLLDQIWRQSLRRSATAGHVAGCRR